MEVRRVQSLTHPTNSAVAHRVLRPRGPFGNRTDPSRVVLTGEEASQPARDLPVQACAGQRAPRGDDVVSLRKPGMRQGGRRVGFCVIPGL
jgi:hypothetical protein